MQEKERPIISIAHSLGGIVVKQVKRVTKKEAHVATNNYTQALLQTQLELRYKSIQNITLGILFFGTPHRGSDKAMYGKVLATVA